MLQRAVDVVQQPVQRVPHDADFVVGVGVLGANPHADLVVVAGEWHRGDGRGGCGEGNTDHPHGQGRRDHQCGRDKHAGRDLFSGDDAVRDAQRNPDDQAVGSGGAAVDLIGTQAAQRFDT